MNGESPEASTSRFPTPTLAPSKLASTSSNPAPPPAAETQLDKKRKRNNAVPASTPSATTQDASLGAKQVATSSTTQPKNDSTNPGENDADDEEAQALRLLTAHDTLLAAIESTVRFGVFRSFSYYS